MPLISEPLSSQIEYELSWRAKHRYVHSVTPAHMHEIGLQYVNGKIA